MDMNRTKDQEALGGLVQAISQCVAAHTQFAEWAERLLAQAESCAQASGKRPSGSRKEFLGVRELASVLPLSPATIRHLAKTNQIPSSRVGKKIVFNVMAVLAALDRTSPRPKRSNRNGSKALQDTVSQPKSLN